MKYKITKVILSFIISIFLVLIILLSINSLAESNYDIEVVDTDYEFLETMHQKFNKYDIIITLKNNGDEDSDDITIKVREENEGENLSVFRNGTVKAGETMQFSFEDWIVSGTGEHTVIYEYFPTNENIETNNYNSGTGSFKINDGSVENEDTPGFELVLVLLAIISIYLIKRRKK